MIPIGKLKIQACVHGCIFFHLFVGVGIGKMRIFWTVLGKIRYFRGEIGVLSLRDGKI